MLCAGSALCLLAGCMNGPVKTPVAKGLTYVCDGAGGKEVVMTFLDGGYLPGGTVRTWSDKGALARGEDGRLSEVPRSQAKLKYGDAEHSMTAVWAEEGLRYWSDKPHDGYYLSWSVAAEDARVERYRALENDRVAEQPEPDAVTCQRSGRDVVPPEAEEHHDGEGHASEEPHRR